MSELTFKNFPARALAERQILTLAIDGLIGAGFKISVFDGEAVTIKASVDRQAIADALWTTDDDHLYIYKVVDDVTPRERFGWVHLVYGNDGADVISDYTTNLADALHAANTRADELLS